MSNVGGYGLMCERADSITAELHALEEAYDSARRAHLMRPVPAEPTPQDDQLDAQWREASALYERARAGLWRDLRTVREWMMR